MPSLTPPRAEKVPYTHTEHGVERPDPYYWLRERENPKVKALLEADNAYLEQVLEPVSGLREQLFEELKGRIKKHDQSVPVWKDGYYTYSEVREGDEHARIYRKKGSLSAAPELLLDGNALAKDKEYFQLGSFDVAPNQEWIAFTIDTVGRRKYDLYVERIGAPDSRKMIAQEITPQFEWAQDSDTLLFVKQDPETLRWSHVYRVKRDGSDTSLSYFEKDTTFRVVLDKSKSDDYFTLTTFNTVTSEVWLLPANHPTQKWSVVEPRKRGHEYSADIDGGRLLILSNSDGKSPNFELFEAPITSPGRKHWKRLIAHSTERFLEDVSAFKDFFVTSEREAGLPALRVHFKKDKTPSHTVPATDPAYLIALDSNPNYETTTFRYSYESMTTPDSVLEWDPFSKKSTLLKEDEVLGSFNKSDYISERKFAVASDGARIPVTLVFKKTTLKSKDTPLLLYGYGSYGYSLDPNFSANRLSLLDRGWVFAFAHIRGGQELGRPWYDQGRTIHKMNTFTDFIRVGESLIEEGYTSSRHLFAMGGSAGGLLMGAVMNLRPELFHGVVAQVPFVDVVTTMLDTSIPLTTEEYDEWGNPQEKEAFQRMLKYSPYDNVHAAHYPHLLVTSGFHDSQVQYWEPTKWVQRLRDLTESPEHMLLLHTDLSAGHGGKAGRFERLKEIALEYAFLIEAENRE